MVEIGNLIEYEIKTASKDELLSFKTLIDEQIKVIDESEDEEELEEFREIQEEELEENEEE